MKREIRTPLKAGKRDVDNEFVEQDLDEYLEGRYIKFKETLEQRQRGNPIYLVRWRCCIIQNAKRRLQKTLVGFQQAILI